MKTSTLTLRKLGAMLSMLALPLAALGQVNYATPYTFVTLAGTAQFGSADGTGSAARFFYPVGVAMDGAGNLYVADLYNHAIRKRTPAAEVTTLAGLAGFEGGTDGTGTAARFSYPNAVAVDDAGDLYVADALNHAIRKVTPAGEVITLAGLAGVEGSADGTGSAARFNQPYGVAVDSVGNVCVADAGNHTIRKVTPTGEVTTLAGVAGSPGSNNGTGSAARFHGPGGVALDGVGNVYVADTANHTIRKVTPTGEVTTLAGLAGYPGSNDGSGPNARFTYPYGVTVDSAGNVYVGDTYNHTIRKMTPTGAVTTPAGLAGNPGFADGTSTAARFDYPLGVVVDNVGNVYVGDANNCAIRKMTPSGAVTTVAGFDEPPGHEDGAGRAARFHHPWGVSVDASGFVYVADHDNHTIRKVTASGVVTTLAGLAGSPGSQDGPAAAARFRNPVGVALDGAGNVYVAEYGNHTIRKVTTSGMVTTLAGLAGSPGSQNGTGAAARFRNPVGVALDGAGNVYVAEYGNHTIRKVTTSGMVTTLAGLAGSPGSQDGPGAAARFRNPVGVALDGAGNVYVADAANFTIRKMTPAGQVTTPAGMAGVPFIHRDGTGNAARFVYPRSVAVDNSANVYVGDVNSIRKVTPMGEVTTLAGYPLADPVGNPLPGGRDGTGRMAGFNDPIVTVDTAGNLYAADVGSHIIRKGIPASSVPAPVLAPPNFTGGQFGFDITGLSGLTMDLETSRDLSQWQEVGILILEGGTHRFVSPNLAPGAQFYRTHVR